MAALTDERVTSVLRTFVRACNTVLPDRPSADVEARVRWWLNRPGRLTALAASVTGLAGAAGDLLPLQDALGAAGEGLLLCAMAHAHGVTDVETKVRLLAAVLFDREMAPEPVAAPTEPAPRRVGVKPTAKWLWRQARLLMAVSDELEKRPKGRFYHHALGMLPIVGMAGDYLGERAALRRTARTGTRWLRQHVS